MLPALVTGCLLAVASPAEASSGWSDYYGDAGQVTVSADRKRITICDLDSRDDLEFKADYATDNPIDPHIYAVAASRAGVTAAGPSSAGSRYSSSAIAGVTSGIGTAIRLCGSSPAVIDPATGGASVGTDRGRPTQRRGGCRRARQLGRWNG
jgi:hypothetical protein